MGSLKQECSEISINVKEKGDQAVFEYTEKFDRGRLDAENIEVTDAEIEEAYAQVDDELVRDYPQST